MESKRVFFRGSFDQQEHNIEQQDSCIQRVFWWPESPPVRGRNFWWLKLVLPRQIARCMYSSPCLTCRSVGPAPFQPLFTSVCPQVITIDPYEANSTAPGKVKMAPIFFKNIVQSTSKNFMAHVFIVYIYIYITIYLYVVYLYNAWPHWNLFSTCTPSSNTKPSISVFALRQFQASTS